MKLYFVRHGESQANLLHEFSNRGVKHALTPHGVEQAEAVAQQLCGEKYACIHHSPVLRAAQTAGILSERLGVPLQVAEPLREWDVGIYEGTTDPTGWEWHTRVQEDWFLRGDYDSKMPGGESYSEIRARFMPFITTLVQRHRQTGDNLILVAHGGLYMAMLPELLNIPRDFAMQHGFGYTACTIARATDESLVCLSWCGLKW